MRADATRSHTAPAWWRDAKFGIMITWGAYAVPAYAPRADSFLGYAEWYWFFQQIDPDEYARVFPSEPAIAHRDEHRARYGEGVGYDDLLDRWRAESWDPGEWVRLFEEAGARYFVLVAKHHDGVALWPTATSDRHTVALGPRRDIVGELLDAAGQTTLRAGLFYAMAEWFTPAHREGRTADPDDPLFALAFNTARVARDSRTGEPSGYRGYRPIDDYVRDHVVPQIVELIERYRPSILWFDLPADPDVVDADGFARRFYEVGAEAHPEGVLVNDLAVRGRPGDFTVVGADFARAEQIGPFEVCRSAGSSFGFNAGETDDQRASSGELVTALVDVVSAGGNLLLNVGPRADGTIAPADEALLRDIGCWLRANGVAIYGSQPWIDAPADGIRFTVGHDGILYAFLPPDLGAHAELPVFLTAGARVCRVADGADVPWQTSHRGIRVACTPVPSSFVAGAPVALELGRAVDVRRARP